jgi:hypothetical protein
LEFELKILDKDGGALVENIPAESKEQMFRLDRYTGFAERQIRRYARDIIRTLSAEERQQVARELARMRARLKEVNRDRTET